MPKQFREIPKFAKTTNTSTPIRSDEIHIRWSDKTTHLHVDASSSLKTLLNGDNYQSCAKLAAIALIRKGNIRLVNGEITAPKDTISARPASPIENIL